MKFKTKIGLFEVVKVHKDEEYFIKGDEFIKRVNKLSNPATKEDGVYLFKHQDEIPKELHNSYLVFPNWRHHRSQQHVSYFYWNGSRWYQDWYGLNGGWHDLCLALRLCTKDEEIRDLDSQLLNTSET
jgi:hypothetical protein